MCLSQVSTQATRRQFTAGLGAIVGAAGLRQAHAAGDDEIRVAVIGCGGRGTGATVDALQVPGGNLKVGVGLMCRHCDRRAELKARLEAGEAGDMLAFRGYRNQRPFHNLDLFPGHGEMPELLWQVRRFHNFLWASGGIFSDYCIHHIDEVCWMKGAWPVKAEAIGGRQFRGRINDQNFDNYSIEYTFPDGSTFFYQSRLMKGCRQEFGVFGVFGQGAKGAFTISTSGHSLARSAIYKSQRMEPDNIRWAAEQPEPNPYRREWEHLVAAIPSGEPSNKAARGAEASLVAAMGRIASHVGRPLTYQEALDWGDDLTAGVAEFTAESPANTLCPIPGNTGSNTAREPRTASLPPERPSDRG